MGSSFIHLIIKMACNSSFSLYIFIMDEVEFISYAWDTCVFSFSTVLVLFTHFSVELLDFFLLYL